MIKSDFHCHTSFSTDSDAPAKEMIDQAIALGFDRICITDHQDMGAFPNGNFLLPADYYLQLKQLQQAYASKIQVEIGVEMGLIPDNSSIQAQIDAYATSQPWDFIIGSTHVVKSRFSDVFMDPYYPEYWAEYPTTKDAVCSYYETTLKNIQQYDIFQIYGHIDYARRYIPQGYAPYDPADYDDWIDQILRELISRGKGIECNTAGFKYGLGQPNPDQHILKRYKELGGEILTIGSDGHAPAHLAYDFQKLPALLTSCGFHEYTVFEQKQPIMIRIEE